MKDFEASCLLIDALEVAKTPAFENEKVKRLLNSLLVVTMEHQNEHGLKVANEIYELLKNDNYYKDSAF